MEARERDDYIEMTGAGSKRKTWERKLGAGVQDRGAWESQN